VTIPGAVQNNQTIYAKIIWQSTTGASQYEFAKILSNTINTITIDGVWSLIPVSTNGFSVCDEVWMNWAHDIVVKCGA